MTKKEVVVLVLISILFFIFIRHDINSWYYSAIGDEYAFFNQAKEIAINNKKISIFSSSNSISILNQNGVYNIVPTAVSFYQATVMRIFGINHQGWITASILTTVLSFFPLYLFTKLLFDKGTAIFAIILYASSHTLWAFNHLGYWNIFGFFPFFSSLLFYLLGLKKKKKYLFTLSGIFSGLCLLTNYFARASFLIIIFLLLFDIYKNKKNWQFFLFYLIGFLLIFIPFLLVNEKTIFTTLLDRSLLNSGEIPENQKLFYFFKNLADSFLSVYRNSQIAHFVSGSLIDVITASFFTVGLMLLLFKIEVYRILFFSLGILLILTGGMSQYTHIGIDRVLFVLPIIATIAGFGLKKIYDLLKKKSEFSFIFLIIVLPVIFGLNFYRFYFETPKKIQLTSEAVMIKALQNNCSDKKSLIIYQYYQPVLQPALESYNLLNKVKLIKNEEFDAKYVNIFECFILKANGEEIEKIAKELKKQNLSFEEIRDYSGLTKIIVGKTFQ